MYQDTDWPTPMKNFQRNGYSNETLEPPLQLSWKFQTGGYVWANPVVSNGTVYFPTPKQGLCAVDLITGNTLWEDREFIKAGNVSATLSDDKLFICGEEFFCKYDAATGTLRWKIPSNGRHSTPCVVGDLVYWGDMDRHLNAARVDSGEIVWRFDAGHINHAVPTADGERIYFSCGETVYSLDALNGDFKWSVKLRGYISIPREPTSLVGDMLLVAVTGLGLLAFDKYSGEQLWRFEHGTTSPSSHPGEGVSYVALSKLYAVDIKTGCEIWRSEELGLSESAPIIVGDHIYIGGGHWQKIYALDRSNGEMVWEYSTEDLVYSTPAYSKGRLVIGCHDGYMYCFEEV
jgi:outer membrane protein assembly factor BamB